MLRDTSKVREVSCQRLATPSTANDSVQERCSVNRLSALIRL
jgi:hypothetical protein